MKRLREFYWRASPEVCIGIVCLLALVVGAVGEVGQ
jgi:hypothetical protein